MTVQSDMALLAEGSYSDIRKGTFNPATGKDTDNDAPLPEGWTVLTQYVDEEPHMKRRTILGGLVAAPLLSGCIWPREFDLEWDEEVQLHDGRVIVVHLKHTYECCRRPKTEPLGVRRKSWTTWR
jgi:hypothetical protein